MATGPQPPGTQVQSATAFVRALNAAGAGTVLPPEDPEYAAVMGRLFSSEAAVTRPLCIAQPESSAQVAAVLKVARDAGCAVTVRGGGLSPLCAGDQAVMIDLSARMTGGICIGDDAHIAGGATMGTLLATLAPVSRLVPIGVLGVPGLGLPLRGGVGHLSRSAGLTLDHVREVELVTASGEVLTLSEQSRGDEADLWWAVRGAGPHFGVVTAVTFRSRPAPPRLLSRRLVFGLDALAEYLQLATSLPRDVSASAALGPPAARPGEPVLFVFIVCAGDSPTHEQAVQEITRRLTSAGGNPLFDSTDHTPYPDMPPYDVPELSRSSAAPGTQGRIFKSEKCPFLRPLDAAAAARLAEAIRAAPNALCRIDLQHCGGAVADVSPTATAFWNRNFEWNCPVIGPWLATREQRQVCGHWVRQTVEALAPWTVGSYSVEIVPGLPETAAEVEQAYGGNLPRLRQLKKKWDPDNVFRLYYPL